MDQDGERVAVTDIEADVNLSDNLYVTDASSYVGNGGVGPTLTIMALTARACEHIAGQA